MATFLMVVALVVFAWAAVAWLARSSKALDWHIGGLSLLLGGWRASSWPSGVQEEDPEVAWATHHERSDEATNGSARSPDGALSQPWALDADGEPTFTSTIELLD